MNKTILFASTEKFKNETKEALQLLYDNINKGQRKQLIKREEIKKLFDKYDVEY